MKKKILAIPGARSSETGFNPVVSAAGFLFLTSQLSSDLATGMIIPGGITDQTTKAMDNVKQLLASCGAEMDDVVRTVIYLRRAADRDRVNEVYRRYFTNGEEPAKVTVVAPSPIEGVDVEIEATAVSPQYDVEPGGE
jgi:2-iminobutanoate/2-iminopropanoate deaminase